MRQLCIAMYAFVSVLSSHSYLLLEPVQVLTQFKVPAHPKPLCARGTTFGTMEALCMRRKLQVKGPNFVSEGVSC